MINIFGLQDKIESLGPLVKMLEAKYDELDLQRKVSSDEFAVLTSLTILGSIKDMYDRRDLSFDVDYFSMGCLRSMIETSVYLAKNLTANNEGVH